MVKKAGKHLRFYINCMETGEIPGHGLCGCDEVGLFNEGLLSLFIPNQSDIITLHNEKYIVNLDVDSFWGAGTDIDDNFNAHNRAYSFTPLRQTIVLFMAAINNEL